ncbi:MULTISPECIES: WXG100 family type VII secretion target [Streptomyces]|uniref:WXG100 family type VII secretion target n=1 Tax=unclassified Streptomyces TaxID=2593676 RepID=UPI000DBAD2DE|nr:MULTISPECIES: WXG100 family type VII secretion target [Streptomyces]MYU08033.1 WXG100 family type VII secretion target [Streptomyces sp. SID8366]MYU63998.1 WXG100 family type VII secretion target [Streptomyces sp. SID69]QHC28096.1 WXG100 family type VII secretion target [Streptomyces sp. HF10]RAJ59227.1 WXG100 family type VII secretion target [Streptomyces sp. PsTaAH-130]TXJ76228.1 WXG100 family type VII secretion target [Streptomyces lavendulae]
MALTSVELQGMTAAQGSFQTALDETTGSYAQMDGQIEGLRASWSGEAANIYHTAMQDWLTDFDKVNQSLRTMLEKLAQNTHVYANTHENTQQQAQQVAQQMGSGSVGLPGFPS